MQRIPLGNTSLKLTKLALGGGQLGTPELDEQGAEALLNGVLDAGINVIDTGRCYGESEVRIGNYLSHRRDDFVLVTKCCPHWDPELGGWGRDAVRKSIESSLVRLRTDHVDVLLLHGCPGNVIREGDVLAELQRCKDEGLARYIGCSGDNDAALAAVRSGVIDCLETSLSICDQRVIDLVLPEARERGVGVLAKRSIAGSCWRDLSGYSKGFDYSQYNQDYTTRLAAMGFTPESLGFDGDWPELALRFSLSHEEVSSALVGCRTATHVPANIQAAEKGALPADVYQAIREAWQRSDDGSWAGRG
ncbi:MAG: aldo/keto reductase [Lentisphaerae bacterium]|jgi:aryl-alcohol dehydrogenase-like predicted oxidoreductase|nr:aldo/keto reductase [Lentisphaerota bacterium]MBT5609178.1 aldo/keto reductase [Lentisphaerota bacterium]MBT7053618.1 aldo/keto reductase [Lentisphaerota bacterium]MBT7845723.1 aldo/keto reductase [Lentisphaerota bacterium]